MADYAISNVPRRVVYAPSGTGPYAFTFEILAAGDIAVYKGDTLLTLTTDYSVTINANGTGSVTLVVTAGTSNITIVGSKTIARTTDFTTGGDFFANTLNDELDAQTIFIQQVAETAERGLKAPVTDPTDINMTLPRKADRAGKYLAFDANGNPAPGDTAVEVAAVFAIREEIEAVAAIDTEVVAVAGNSTNVNLVAGSISNVNTVGNNIANVNATATNIANVNAVGADLLEAVSEINTVAVSIANVDAVGTNIGNVNSVAGNATNINAVAGNSTNINTVATNNANVTTVAGISANVTTVAGISANVTSVAGNSTNINAVAGNATNINAVNANSTNINSVAGNSTNINTVAGISSAVTTVSTNNANVSTVATNIAAVNTNATNIVAIQNASTNATNAATSATAAQTAQSAAESARDATLAAYDNFDDRYLGSKTSNPTLDNDGNALAAGALYFNSVSGAMQVYTGSAWVAAYVSGTGFLASANNLSDVSSTSSARTNLGLGTGNTPTFTGVVTGAGTVSAPAITTTGDTNTGIFFPAADTIAFTEGGVESMRIDASGNVGIGTNSPAFKLDTIVTTGNAVAVRPNNGTTGLQTALRLYGHEAVTTSRYVQIGCINNGGTDVNELAFYTGSGTSVTERMRIDSSGNVGIGVTPSNWGSAYKALQVGQNSSLAGNTSASVSLLSTNTVFDGSSFKYITTDAATQYQQNTGAHIWRTAASGSAGATLTFTQVLSVEGSKSLSLQGATPQAGTGITFPATQSASSDANTLDDYEEGTFTPSWSSTGASFTYDSSYRVGRYIKIGNVVNFSIYISTASAPTGTTSNPLSITGLPFTSGGSAFNFFTSVSFGQLYLLDWPAGKLAITGRVVPSTIYVDLAWEADSAISASATPSNLLASCYVMLSGFYYAA